MDEKIINLDDKSTILIYDRDLSSYDKIKFNGKYFTILHTINMYEENPDENPPYGTIFYDNDIQILYNTTSFSYQKGLAFIHMLKKGQIISGSEVLEMAITYLKKFNGVFNTVQLYDQSHVKCDDNYSINFTLYKILEKGYSFYQKFGFNYKTSTRTNIYDKLSIHDKILDVMTESGYSIDDIKLHNQAQNMVVENLNKWTFDEIYINLDKIINNFEKEQRFEIEIKFLYNDKLYKIILNRSNYNFLYNKIIKCLTDIYNILNIYKVNTSKTFTEFLVNLFKNKNCSDYNTIIKTLIEINDIFIPIKLPDSEYKITTTICISRLIFDMEEYELNFINDFCDLYNLVHPSLFLYLTI